MMRRRSVDDDDRTCTRELCSHGQRMY
jgi:hypothetical protein